MLRINYETSKKRIYDNYLTLMDLLSNDLIFDDDISNKLDRIRNNRAFLPKEINEFFDSFINEYIYPIICTYPTDKEFQTSDLGHVNSNGVFEFNDEESVTEYFCRLMKYCNDVKEILLEKASVTLTPYFE